MSFGTFAAEMEKKKLTTQEDYRQRVDRVIGYIRENLDREINIRTLAELSAFSPFHFHRIMRAYLGEPIGAFIVRTRVETAAKLLKYTDLSISDIAYRVGYDTPSSLTKSFCKLFSISPKEYRLTKSYQFMATQKPKAEAKLSRVKVVEQEPKTVLYMSTSGDYKNLDYEAMYMRIWKEIKHQGIFSAGIEHLALYYNNPEITSEENLKCDVCIRVFKPAQPNGDIGVKIIGGGRFAMFTYIGEYKKVGIAYDKIYGELLAKGGFQTRSNYCYEKYVSDPRRTAPERLKTEIYIPIE
ncbi:MAG: AraC family transcriptional regulator [Bacteroides sp.]|uniref:AraC family transcriptional regulator n=1 Tax=Bacteroides sp. TaxID=29523 RepID=UPI002FCAA06D